MYAQELSVCAKCFDDPGLVEFIKSSAAANECSFCPTKADGPIAASIDDVSEYFIECLFLEYDLAVNKLGWTGAEDGYFGQHWVAEDLVRDELELEFPQDNLESLLPHLFGDYYDQDWCEKYPYSLNDQEHTQYSWERFCRIVKHERRYFFLGGENDDTEVYSPREVLSTIFDYAQEMDLFTELQAGSHLIRARWEGNGPPLETPEDLGPPPVEKATQSNRMSPVGIPMFYACEDEETALMETASDPDKFAVGTFETLRPLNILDLACIPPIPSLFEAVSDNAQVHPRLALTFLHHIAEEMSLPIERDEKVHISYVPTQVVTEFIRNQVTWDNRPINGIRYQSTVHPSHVSYVLFANEGNVQSTSDRPTKNDPWLKLVEVNHIVMDGYIVDAKRAEEEEIATSLESFDDYEVPVEESSHAPSTPFLERLKPVLITTWIWTALVALWTADRLIDLMLLFQAGQRRVAPTRRVAWPKELKEQLMRRQRNICAYCGRRYTAHFFDIDHMDPATYGGSNDPSNLQVLCGPCNRRKGDQTDQEFRQRYAELVPRRRLTPPSRPVSQRQFDAVRQRTRTSMALQQRRRLRFITVREKITTGSLVCGFVAFAAVYLALEGIGLSGNFSVISAVILGIAVGAGLWLRARFTGALYM